MDLAAALEAISTQMIVLKPLDGCCGRGVMIKRRREVELADIPAYPYLAQEFIDSSAGISGVGCVLSGS